MDQLQLIEAFVTVTHGHIVIARRYPGRIIRYRPSPEAFRSRNARPHRLRRSDRSFMATIVLVFGKVSFGELIKQSEEKQTAVEERDCGRCYVPRVRAPGVLARYFPETVLQSRSGCRAEAQRLASR